MSARISASTTGARQAPRLLRRSTQCRAPMSAVWYASRLGWTGQKVGGCVYSSGVGFSEVESIHTNGKR